MRNFCESSKAGEDLGMISFEVREQTFCVDVTFVREIRGWSPTTPVPNAPDFICGIINLRGTVLQIIDLAARLGYGKTSPSARHAIIVVQVGNQLTGLLVDAVSEIISVPAGSIQPVPALGGAVAGDLVRGVFAANERMTTVLGLENLMPQAKAMAA